jgi:hypothetical protein
MACLTIAVFFVAYPNYVIRPDRPQGTGELQTALFALRFQHLAELLCAAIAAGALVLYLRSGPPRRSRTGAVASIAVVFVCAAFSRVDIYEFIFHPAGAPSFQTVAQTRIDEDDRVLAVNARAYPIRTIAYHHIVNDVVNGVPIAVTY